MSGVEFWCGHTWENTFGFVSVAIKLAFKPKVVNSNKVGEVQEGATCFCDKKLSKLG